MNFSLALWDITNHWHPCSVHKLHHVYQGAAGSYPVFQTQSRIFGILLGSSEQQDKARLPEHPPSTFLSGLSAELIPRSCQAGGRWDQSFGIELDWYKLSAFCVETQRLLQTAHWSLVQHGLMGNPPARALPCYYPDCTKINQTKNNYPDDKFA